MTLEDFFKAKGPDNYVESPLRYTPTNYVEYPAKDVPTLEKFFAERTIAPRSAPKMSPNVNPEVQAAVDTAPKLSDQDVDRLAAQANPQMSLSSEIASTIKGPMETMEAPKAPTSTAQMSTDDRFKSLIEEMKKDKPEASWTDFWLGLIPLGLDFLVGGGKGYALPASTQYYDKVMADVNKRQSSLDSKISDLQKMRLQELMKEPKTVEVNEEGKPIIYPVRDAIGKEAWKSGAKTGLTLAERLKLQEAESTGKDKRQERSIRIATRDKLMSNKDYSANRSSYGAANDAVNILNQKNWASDAGVPSLFAKGLFKEVGAMSNQDKAVFFGDPAFVNKFNSVYAKYLDPKGGTYTDEDRAVLMDLALKIREKSKREASAIAGGYIEGLKSEGIDAGAIIKPLLQYNDIKPIESILNFGKPKKRLTFEEFRKLRRDQKLKGQ